MAFCQNCGSPVDGKFCAKCGAAVGQDSGPPSGAPTGQPLGIPIEASGKHFTIVLYVVPGQTEYQVRLDRVWFWKALLEAGLSPTIGKVEAGVEVKVILQGITVTSSTLLTRELDINGNGSVDIIDAGIAALAFGASVGNPKYNPQADFLAHGTIDIVELGVFAFYFNAQILH